MPLSWPSTRRVLILGLGRIQPTTVQDQVRCPWSRTCTWVTRSTWSSASKGDRGVSLCSVKWRCAASGQRSSTGGVCRLGLGLGPSRSGRDQIRQLGGRGQDRADLRRVTHCAPPTSSTCAVSVPPGGAADVDEVDVSVLAVPGVGHVHLDDRPGCRVAAHGGVGEGWFADHGRPDAGLLGDLAEGGLGGIFVRVDVSARVQPQVEFVVMDEQDPVSVVEDYSGRGEVPDVTDHAGCLRRRRGCGRPPSLGCVGIPG